MSDSDETVSGDSPNKRNDAVELGRENSPSILHNWTHTESRTEKDDRPAKTTAENGVLGDNRSVNSIFFNATSFFP